MERAERVPHADEVLGAFFAEQRRAVRGRPLTRLRTAEDDLRACLEHLAPHVLTDPELALLALERQFEPRGAAARVADADAVLLVLPVFLEDPRWRGAELEDRRTRIRLAEPLAHAVLRLPALRGADLGAAAWVVEATVQHATVSLRRELEGARTAS